ncbi:hypothetical protein BC827DRAFT_1266377 [Russula dissimulans]|nr:hypothetical protein BC827DRAFT_1266377 [Russula dissimulans]
MEQRRINSHQPTHHPHDAPPFELLQSSPLYAHFPDILGADSRATHPSHPSPSYAQQPFAPDRNPPLEAPRSPPRPSPLRLHEQSHRGHPHPANLAPPAALALQLQQPQPRPAAAYHPIFPQPHEGHNPTLQGFPPQSTRVPQPFMPMPSSFDPWVTNPFTENASPHPATPRRGIPRTHDLTYSLYPPPRYHLPTTHPSAPPTHAPPEQQSPTTAGPGPPTTRTLHEQQEESASTDHGQRVRSWGAGSLDPTTGVFSRAADHPRIRTAQACEKCRARKAKCSGEQPTCQRCHARNLTCFYAPERRMRGPNKPKPPSSLLQDGTQPAAAEGQKTRRRASTMPSAPRRGLQMWGPQQQQRQKQGRQHQQHEHGTAASASASPASPASSAGSGSLGYAPLSESEASPMTPHSSVDNNRQPPRVGFPASSHVMVQDFLSTARPGGLSHVGGGNGYADDSGLSSEGIVPGVYGQPDMFPDMRMSFKSPKPPF